MLDCKGVMAMAAGDRPLRQYISGTTWSITPAAIWERRLWVANQVGVHWWELLPMSEKAFRRHGRRLKALEMRCGYNRICRYGVTRRVAKRLEKWICPRTGILNFEASGALFLTLEKEALEHLVLYYYILPPEYRTEENTRAAKAALQSDCR